MPGTHAAPSPRHRGVAAGLSLATAGAAVLTAVNSRLPNSLLIPTMIVLISAVDLVASVAAKSWASSPGVWVFVVGATLYILVFWIFAQSLRYGELTVVTVGWVAVVCVGSMVLDRFHYGVHLPLSKWVAALAVIALLGYLMSDVASGSDRPADTRPDTAQSGSGTRS